MMPFNRTDGAGLRRLGGVVVAASLLLWAAAGCDSPGETDKSAPSSGSEQSSGEGFSNRSDTGESSANLEVKRSDSLPEGPERIVSLAPNITETLFAIGAGDRLVGVTKYCDYPDAAKSIPSVGSFANPDFETILARDPDVVLGVISGGPRSVFERMRETDVSYAFLEISTVQQTYAGIQRIGAIIGRRDAARERTETMRRQMKRISDRWNERRGEEPRVLLVYGHEPLVSAGPGTFGHQLLERAGARNVLHDNETQFPRLDAEKVLELAPARILDTAADDRASGREFWAQYDMLQAVQNGEIEMLSDPVVLRPGPRLPEALRRVARAAHGRPTNPDGEESGQ